MQNFFSRSNKNFQTVIIILWYQAPKSFFFLVMALKRRFVCESRTMIEVRVDRRNNVIRNIYFPTVDDFRTLIHAIFLALGTSSADVRRGICSRRGVQQVPEKKSDRSNVRRTGTPGTSQITNGTRALDCNNSRGWVTPFEYGDKISRLLRKVSGIFQWMHYTRDTIIRVWTGEGHFLIGPPFFIEILWERKRYTPFHC